MKRIPKFLLGCGGCLGIVVVVVAFLVGGFLWTSHRHQEGVQVFANEIMPLVASSDYESFEPYFAPEISEAADPKEYRRIFNWFKQLGELQSFEEPKLVNIQAATSIPYSKILLYRFLAHYSNGDASVDLSLVQDSSGRYFVWGIHINSEALLPQTSEEQPSSEKRTTIDE